MGMDTDRVELVRDDAGVIRVWCDVHQATVGGLDLIGLGPIEQAFDIWAQHVAEAHAD